MEATTRLSAIAAAVADKRLTDAARSLYVALVSTHGVDIDAPLSITDFCDLMDASRPTARRAAAVLAEAGYITRDAHRGYTPLVTVHFPANEWSRAS